MGFHGTYSNNVDYLRNIITKGLLCHVDAGHPESYQGGSVLYDLAKGGNNGSFGAGTKIFIPNNKGVFQFSNINNYIILSNNASIKPPFPFTISIWFKREALTDTYVFTTDNSTLHAGFAIGADVIRFGNNTGSGSTARRDYSINSPAGFGNNVWVNYVCAATSITNIQSYINGNPVSTTYSSGTAATMVYGTSNANIGRRTVTATSYFNGFFSNLITYNRILSSDEVLINYRVLKYRYTDGKN